MTFAENIKCGGIIIDSSKQRVLCVLNRLSHLKGENKWGFPKGHMDNNETYYKCAQREIKEETGLYFKKYKFSKYVKIYNNIYYIIQLKSNFDKININDKKEISKVEWKTIKELNSGNYNRDIYIFLKFIKNYPLTLFDNLKPKYEYNINKNFKKIYNNLPTKTYNRSYTKPFDKSFVKSCQKTT